MTTEFQAKVQKAVDCGMQGQIAEKFEVALSTVRRWSEGVARPHPRIHALVLNFLGS